jgi:glycosyltransferase involved in cell wall biosynthesis
MHEDYRAGRGPEGMALRALERWCFRWVDHVVLANPTARPIVATADVPVTLIKNYPRWMPGTAPSSPFPDTPDRHAPRRLVCTGVQSVERGLLTLVDLAALLAESADDAEWRLDCVGVCYRPDDRRRVEAHVRHRPAATRVLRRIGWDAYVPHATIAEATARAHVGLALFRPHPAHARVLLTKFYEYLRHGLPILCSDFPLWRRFVQAHGCGAVVPPGDAEAAARVLRRWRADPARYRALCEGARRAAPRFRWSVMGARLVRLYRHLMA